MENEGIKVNQSLDYWKLEYEEHKKTAESRGIFVGFDTRIKHITSVCISKVRNLVRKDK